jgi:hypothetical protein
MLQPTKNKEFIGIIKSGLVGAFAFTGISFIWVIVSMFKGPCGSVVVTTFMDSPKFDFAKEALIVIVCIGFMLGVLLRRCFPIMQRRFFLLVTMLVMLVAIVAKEALIVIVCISFILGVLLLRCFPIMQRRFYLLVIMLVMAVVPLGFVIYFFHEMAMGTELPPVNLKLADCTNNVVNVHLEIPAGRAYQLELKGPGIEFSTGGEWKSSYNFSGHLRISSNGSLLTDLPIGSDKAWLTGSGYVLTGAGMQNTNIPPLSKFIQSHKSYDFEISFEPPPPPGSSIWLYCLVSVRDQ